jgi:hypothetical protein
VRVLGVNYATTTDIGEMKSMRLIVRTFDDALAAMRKAGGPVCGRLPDSRVITLTTTDVDPGIAIDVREKETRTSEELLGVLSNVPGSLG